MLDILTYAMARNYTKKVAAELEGKIEDMSALKFKGIKTTVNELPLTGEIGDFWLVGEDNCEYFWTGSAWEAFGGVISSDDKPELVKFVDILPQSGIDLNSYYMKLSSKIFPDATNIHANNRAVIITHTEANGWRLMSVQTDVSPQILYGNELYLWNSSGLAPKSLPHTIYEIKPNYTWGKMSGYEDGDITSDGWEALMSMDSPDVPTNVQFTEYIKLCIGGHGPIQGITNKADISGTPIGSTEINPYEWLEYKYVDSTWEIVGICDFEELFKRINTKVLSDYITTAALNTALATKEDAPITATNINIAATDWVSDNTYTDYPYKKDITIQGVTSSMEADVYLNPTSAALCIIAPFCVEGTNKITIYSSSNENAVVIDKVVVR